ncbi:hypothetical protein [Sorangium sp. So ce887]|uniref:hypothetical protein n=1 Tax=Sorangium sp. So ce887 TaxID=3133324 RepID=UPI003F5E42B5
MRVRIILENVGHTMSKLIELPEPPKVGDVVTVDRGRQRVVGRVEHEPETDVHVVSLTEDEYDLEIYLHPRIHLEHLAGMMEDGWEIEGEEELRRELRERLSRQGDPGPIAQN